MNKKGQAIIAGKWGYYLVYIVIFTISIAIAAGYINNKVLSDVDFSDLESDVVGNMVFECLKGSEFGIINKDKLTDSNLQSCFNPEVYHVKAKLKDGAWYKNYDFSSDNELRYYVLAEEQGKIEGDILLVEFENVA